MRRQAKDHDYDNHENDGHHRHETIGHEKPLFEHFMID